MFKIVYKLVANIVSCVFIVKIRRINNKINSVFAAITAYFIRRTFDERSDDIIPDGRYSATAIQRCSACKPENDCFDIIGKVVSRCNFCAAERIEKFVSHIA